MWWAAEGRAVSRARWALQLQHLDLPTTDEPLAAIILATADRKKVDKRTRSKWSRVLRYAAEYKTSAEPLATGSTNVRGDLLDVLGDTTQRLIEETHPIASKDRSDSSADYPSAGQS
jgi:hypothetical protein